MSSLHSAQKAEPNLVPILDMVFQLITFFMLVINFKTANMDLSLKLPVVGSARPVDIKGQGDFLVLNINPQGQLIVQGAERPDIQGYIASEGQAAQLMARRKDRNFKPGDELPVTVVIRADRSTPFHLLYRVVKVCQEQGYRKFNYMALNKPAEAGT